MGIASSQPDERNTREDVEVREIVAALRGPGLLTLARLRELCWADRWPERDFAAALRRALATGEIRHLGDERYETAGPPAEHESP